MEKNVRANHIAEGVVLLEDLDGGGIGNLGVFNDLNSINEARKTVSNG